MLDLLRELQAFSHGVGQDYGEGTTRRPDDRPLQAANPIQIDDDAIAGAGRIAAGHSEPCSRDIYRLAHMLAHVLEHAAPFQAHIVARIHTASGRILVRVETEDRLQDASYGSVGGVGQFALFRS